MSYVVNLAAAEVLENPKASEALKEFASIRPRDAENKAHTVLEKHGLTCAIEINRVDLAEGKRYKGFPYIRFSTWVKYLLDTGRLTRQLCACQNLESMQAKLEEFWKRYQSVYPTHQLFTMKEAGVDLSLVIPVFSHTDEGRSYKKQALWLLSTHGALGRGTRGFLRKKKDKLSLKRCGLGLNFCGHTWSTHYMFACMLRKFFKKKPQVLDDLVGIYAKDMEELLLQGVWSSDRSVHVRCCHIGTKGDLPALTRMGNMKYSFGNCPRQSRSRKPCEGICWMCCAGQEDNPSRGLNSVPYEDTSGRPLWEATLGQRLAWDETPPMLKGVPMLECDSWMFYKTDVWHNFHLGLAKHWVASSLVSMLENLPMRPQSMDDKVEWLGEEYKKFCTRRKISPHCEELGRETLNWHQSSNCPVGAWNKGSASTHYMLFLENLCSEWSNEIEGEPLLEAIAPSMLIRFNNCFIFSIF